jgi:hypothetical protein
MKKGWLKSHPFFVYLSIIIYIKTMKTINVSPDIHYQWYESPVIQVLSLNSEGVLCQSGQFEEWNEETLQW